MERLKKLENAHKQSSLPTESMQIRKPVDNQLNVMPNAVEGGRVGFRLAHLLLLVALSLEISTVNFSNNNLPVKSRFLKTDQHFLYQLRDHG